MKHTPGPWKMGSMVTCGTEAQHIEITRNGDPYMVAKVCVQGDMVSIGRPNARLIAAAPTLLALVCAYRTTCPLDVYADIADEIIRAATGK